jgi:hypothetical protein
MGPVLYQTLLDQARIDGWIGIVAMCIAAALGFGLVPWMFRRSRELAAVVLILASLFLFVWGSTHAASLLNPTAYIIAHCPRD